MPKTLKEMRERVRSILQEPVPARWSDEDINGYLNEGLLDLAFMAQRPKSTEIPLAAGQSTVTFPSDFLSIREIYWGDTKGKKPLYLAVEDLPLDDETKGTPKKFYLLNGTIEIRPIPDEAKNVYIVYVATPKELVNDNDVPEFPRCERVLISYAVYRAYYEDGDPRSQLWRQDFDQQLVNWLTVDRQTQPTNTFQVKDVW
ncbi:hypothetical protein BSNK01_11890 [Bacillaceae bacterium]